MGLKNKEKIINVLNEIMQYELSGVVRYTHYALMVTGRDRLSLTQFFKEQATESLLPCSTGRRIGNWPRWTPIAGDFNH